jgi:hypothetical protein
MAYLRLTDLEVFELGSEEETPTLIGNIGNIGTPIRSRWHAHLDDDSVSE